MSDEEFLEDLLMVGPPSRRRRPRRRPLRNVTVFEHEARQRARQRRRGVRPGETAYMDEEVVRARPSVDMEPMRVEGRRGRATRLNQAQAARRQGEEKDRRGRARDLLRSLRRRY